MYNTSMRTFGITDALLSLAPGAQWSLSGDTFDGLTWLSEDIDVPAEDAVLAEVVRLQEEYDARSYQRLRATEYPDFKEYLDGIVKGDQAQVDKYIADCIAVKEKYPKPV